MGLAQDGRPRLTSQLIKAHAEQTALQSGQPRLPSVATTEMDETLFKPVMISDIGD